MKFRIYNEGKYEFLTTNYVVYSLFILTLLPVIIISWTNYQLTTPFKVISVIGIILVCIFNFYRIIQRHRHEKLRGYFAGNLLFSEDNIAINNTEYNISTIQKIEIEAKDYFNKNDDNLSKYDYNGSLSNGVNNKLLLSLTNGQNINIRFEQINKDDILNLKEILISYNKKGKMSMLKLTDALNITDYNDIQDLKKHYR